MIAYKMKNHPQKFVQYVNMVPYKKPQFLCGIIRDPCIDQDNQAFRLAGFKKIADFREFFSNADRK